METVIEEMLAMDTVPNTFSHLHEKYSFHRGIILSKKHPINKRVYKTGTISSIIFKLNTEGEISTKQ